MTFTSESQLRIPVSALSALGMLAPSLSPLSPLRSFGDETPNPDLLSQLGLLKDGRLSAKLASIFETLASPQATSILTYQTGSSSLCWISCFLSPDAVPVCLCLSGDDAVISEGIGTSGLLPVLQDCIGMSSLKTSDNVILVEAVDALAWLQFADSRRIQQLQTLLGVNKPGANPDDIIDGSALEGQRLADLATPGQQHADSVERLAHALPRLLHKGLSVRQSDGEWQLTSEGEELIKPILLLEGIATIQARRMTDDGRVARASISYVQAGVSAILAMTSEPEGLRIWSESPLQAIAQIRLFMEHGDELPLPEMDSTAEERLSDKEDQSSSIPDAWHLAINGIDQGSFTVKDLCNRLKLTAATDQCLVWKPGLNEWISPEQAGLSAPSPVPNPAPPPLPISPTESAPEPIRPPSSDSAPSHHCPACGAATRPNASFCGSCGHPLSQTGRS